MFYYLKKKKLSGINLFCIHTQHKKASNHRANLPLEMYSFTL